MFASKSNKKLPPKHDKERTIREHEALQSKDKILEVTEALSEGKLPTTSQISETIDEIHQSELLYDAARGISVFGKKVLADLEKLLDSLKRFLEEKNAGNELQNVVYYGAQIAKGISANRETEVTSKTLIEGGIKNTLNISRLIVTSSEFRKLINDIATIAQDIIAEHEPSSGTSTPEKKGKNGKVAETKVGKKDKEEETKDKNGMVSGIKNGKDGKEKEQGIGEAVSETSQKAPGRVLSTATESTSELAEPRIKDQDSIKEGFKAIASDTISGYQHSPEVRERLVSRFKSVMIEIQKKPEYQQAIKDLINTISQITEKSSEFAAHITQPTAVASSSIDGKQKQASASSVSSSTAAVEVVEENAKELIEKFANNRSLDPLISALNNFGQEIKHDGDLREFLKELEHFILSSLLESEFVKEADYIQKGSSMIDKGREILLGHYGELAQTIVSEVQEFNQAMMEDKATMELKRDVNILIEDLFLNEFGQFTFKFQLVKDLAIILPRLAKKLEYIPLPKYEYSDENIELNADNIVLRVYGLFPKYINIGLNADIDLDRPEENRVRNLISIEISKLHIDARNIAFYYKKKKGFFKFKDVGYLDFSIPQDDGIQLYFRARLTIPTDGSKPISIKLERDDSHISKFKLRFHNTKHNLENLITRQTNQFTKSFEKQMIIVQTKIMQNYRRYSTTKDISSDQSEDKLKQKMAWKSTAFDPTLGTTTIGSSNNSGGASASASAHVGGDIVGYNVTTPSTPTITTTPINTVTSAITDKNASIIKTKTDGKAPGNK